MGQKRFKTGRFGFLSETACHNCLLMVLKITDFVNEMYVKVRKKLLRESHFKTVRMHTFFKEFTPDLTLFCR